MLGTHTIKHAVERAGIDGAEVEDAIMACAMQQGTVGVNIDRLTALADRLPTSVGGMSLDRQCSSGLISIATTAKHIIHDGMDVTIGEGLESISLVQNEQVDSHITIDKALAQCIKTFTCQCYKPLQSYHCTKASAANSRMNRFFY
jgi:acetyl-CoA C-acetyltransferase